MIEIRLIEGYKIILTDNEEYRFQNPKGEILFEGNDFKPGYFNSFCSMDSAFSLMGFLTLKEGDVEPEYFEDYTRKQIAFMEDKAEELSLYPLYYEEGYILSFIEIDTEEETKSIVYRFDTTLEENQNYLKAFETIIEMGIDSHLEAFTESSFERQNDILILRFNISESDILIRRLKEKGFFEISEEIERIRNNG
jgi:hypothetical protein